MNTPGLVTSNVVGGTPYQSIQDQAAAYDLQQRMKKDKEAEWASAAAANNAKRAQEVDPDAEMKAAYEKVYGPYMQSIWDMNQGQIGGVDSRRVSGDPRLGSVYQKGAGIGQGQQPYKYGQDTNMPGDMYQDELNKAYEMWKAGQMMGFGDIKVHGTGSRTYGGGEKGGAGQSY